MRFLRNVLAFDRLNGTRHTIAAGAFVVTALLAIAASPTAWGAVVPLPYSNDFSGTGTNTDLPYENTAANGSWTVGGGVYTYTQNAQNSGGVSALEDFGLGLNNIGTFRMSIQFKVTALSGSGTNANQVGFILSSNNSNPATVGTTAYYASFTIRQDGVPANVGTLTLGAAGATFDATPTPVVGTTVLTTIGSIINNTYTLVLDGERTASSLALTLSLFDAAGTTKIGTSATATDSAGILTGAYSGPRFRGVMGGTHTVQFDNFTVVVPEPGSLALLATGGLLVARRRR